MGYNYSESHVAALVARCREVSAWAPPAFWQAPAELRCRCYNGIGPEAWSSRLRELATRLLEPFEVAALVHDFEFGTAERSYAAFTVANLRFAVNSLLEAFHRHPPVANRAELKRLLTMCAAGLLLAVLCQQKLRSKKMRKLIAIFAAAVAVAFIAAGCASTHSTITEFDAAGNVIRTTETSESVIKTVTDSTQNKSVLIWEDGWAAYISASSGTVEDPTPHGKIFCGKVNKGALSLLPNQQGLPGIARIIQATKSDITASLTDGVAATSSEIQTAGKGAANE